jgi:hypothetical protein
MRAHRNLPKNRSEELEPKQSNHHILIAKIQNARFVAKRNAISSEHSLNQGRCVMPNPQVKL